MYCVNAWKVCLLRRPSLFSPKGNHGNYKLSHIRERSSKGLFAIQISQVMFIAAEIQLETGGNQTLVLPKMINGTNCNTVQIRLPHLHRMNKQTRFSECIIDGH